MKHPIEVSAEFLSGIFRDMLRIRLFEEKVATFLEAGKIETPCHLYIGQEAIATGVCAALTREDTVWGGHRSHGHYLAKGGRMNLLMAEIFGRKTGCSHGRGGSMHIIAKEVGIFGTVPLVAATIPLAVGAALASSLRGDGRVAVAFFGDGATEEGHFHESMNLAAAQKLPVVFVCENNLYSSHLRITERRAADNIYQSGAAHGMPACVLDGNDFMEVYEASGQAVRRARAGEGPSLLECRSYRWRGHVGPSWDMDVGVKRRDELKEWMEKDPVANLRRRLIDEWHTAENQLDTIVREVRNEVDQAVAFALDSPHPRPSELLEFVYIASEGAV